MPIDNPEPEEDLLHFARRHEVAPEDLTKHPKNAAIFQARSSSLSREDEIFVPEKGELELRTVESGKSHVLVYAPPERVLSLQLHDDDGRPLEVDYTLSNLRYDRTARGDEPGKVHGYAHRGHVYQRLPSCTLLATLEIEGRPELTRTLAVGHLDPVSTRFGLLARLTLLGLYLGPLEADLHTPNVHRALATLQRRFGLMPTGHADPDTRRALVEACGG